MQNYPVCKVLNKGEEEKMKCSPDDVFNLPCIILCPHGRDAHLVSDFSLWLPCLSQHVGLVGVYNQVIFKPACSATARPGVIVISNCNYL